MNLFTYGSLMFTEVWERVTGLTQPGRAARLGDYAACRIRGESYPALVPSPGALTEGILYQEVTPEAIARLDDFEGSFYHRVEVALTFPDGTPVQGWAYLASQPENPGILPERWSAARFAAENLQTFLRHDPGFNGERR